MHAISTELHASQVPQSTPARPAWSFAKLQIAGWGAYFIFHYAGNLSDGEPGGIIFYSLTSAGAALLFSSAMALILRRLWHRPAPVAAAVALLTSFAFAIPFSFVSEQAYFLSRGDGWRLSEPVSYFGSALWCGSILLTWAALWFGLEYYRQAQEARTAAARSAAAAAQARLDHLTSQLNPHFLFNTLNTLSTLVLSGRSEPAVDVIDGLADLLRASLEGDGRPTVPLREELGLARAYLAIEKIRFGERLQCEENIDASALDVAVPRLVLQPLIENAVRYAVAGRHRGARLRIGARIEDGATPQVVLEVCDDGPGPNGHDQPGGHGIGLPNVEERLRTLFGPQARVDVVARDGCCVALSWPLKDHSHGQ